MKVRKSSNAIVVLALIFWGALPMGVFEIIEALEDNNGLMLKCTVALSLIMYFVIMIALAECAMYHTVTEHTEYLELTGTE